MDFLYPQPEANCVEGVVRQKYKLLLSDYKPWLNRFVTRQNIKYGLFTLLELSGIWFVFEGR
jgi:hypothetical protein